MRAKTIDILKSAMEGGYGVGAFNTCNLEITQGIIRAAHALKSPCIVQFTTKSMDYAGDKVLGEMIQSVINNESNSTMVGVHLDHGKTLDDIGRAIEMGADSVMIDASQSSLKENIRVTKRIVDYAHSKGVSVQAELGRVPYLGREDMEVNWDELMADPEEAKKLVEETGVDALAVGIGNAHGFFRERPEPDWERLKKIKSLIPNTPLIIHGASDWSKEKIEKAVANGASCFNIDTDIRVTFSTEICRHAAAQCDVSDPRKFLATARDKVVEKVKEKIKLFRCGK